MTETRPIPAGACGSSGTAQPTADTADEHSRRWLIWAAWPVTAVFMLSNTATPLYPLWRHRLGFSAGMLTVIFACYIAGLLVTLLAAGVISDRLGRKRVLLPALSLGVVACVVFMTADSVAALAAARVLTGIAVGAVVSAGMAAVSDMGGPQRRQLASLLASTAMVLGAGTGPLLSGVLSEALPGPTVTVFAVELVLLASAIAVVVRMPLPPRLPAPAGEGRHGLGAWVRIPSVPPGSAGHLIAGIAVFAPGITATSFVLSLGPSLLAAALATSDRIVSGATAFVMFAAATSVQLAARRLPIRGILLIGAASTTASMVALLLAVHTSSLALLVIAAVLAGAGQGLGQLGGLSLIAANVAPGRLAEANAALNVGGYLPAGALSIGIGYLSDAIGLAAGSTIFALVLMIAAAAGGTTVALRGVTSPGHSRVTRSAGGSWRR